MLEKFSVLLTQAGFLRPQLHSEPSLTLAHHALELEAKASASDRQHLLHSMQMLVHIGAGTLVCTPLLPLLIDILTFSKDITHHIFYEVLPKMRMKRIIPGTGSLCASEYLNHVFRHALKRILGSHLAACMKAWSMDDENKFLDEFVLGSSGFEIQKRLFGSEEEKGKTHMKFNPRAWRGNLPTSKGVPQVKSSYIVLSKEDVIAGFEEYITEALPEIEAKLSDLKDVQASEGGSIEMVFSGGGSQIAYLQQRSTEIFEPHCPISFAKELKQV
jgi:hypothetical protein